MGVDTVRELNIDAKHNQAIRREIGERLRGLLRDQLDVPTRLCDLVRQSAKMVIQPSRVMTFLPSSVRV
jgi:hypothetical protein